MDYLYVFGTDTDSTRAASGLLLRTAPTKQIPHTKDVASVERFLLQLRPNTIPKPIGDILIVAHAGISGYIWLYIDESQPRKVKKVEYEMLVDADAQDSIRLPLSLLTDPVTGVVKTITCHIHGCEIGEAPLWLSKLRDALQPVGATIKVVAPRYMDTFKDEPGVGIFEFLMQRFRITSKTPLGRDDIVAAFQAKGYAYADGRAIPATRWHSWVPLSKFNPKGKIKTKLAVPVFGGNPLEMLWLERWYRRDVVTDSHRIGAVATNPSTDALRLDRLRAWLPTVGDAEGRKIWSSTYHPARYEREGFQTLDEYLAAYTWTFSHDKKNSVLNASGVRYQYRIEMPACEELVDPADFLMDPAPKEYLSWFNFYAYPGSGYANVTKLDESNTTLYTTV